MLARGAKCLSLDTNVILNFAAGWGVALEFKEQFQARGYQLSVVPRVVAELGWAAANGDSEERSVAAVALDNLEAWGIQVVELSSTDRAIANRFAEILLGNGLVASQELNDARILAETSLARIPVLVTSDGHLLGVDEPQLRLAFDDADLMVVTVAHPRGLLRAIR
jgi:predicted nucleic acid-binding protein